jgi:diguanylate cyclase
LRLHPIHNTDSSADLDVAATIERPTTNSERSLMRRVFAGVPWLLAAGALGLGAFVALSAGSFDPFWRVLVVAASLISGYVGRRTNRLPVVFTVVFVFTGVRLAAIDSGGVQVDANRLSWGPAISDVVVGSVLIVLLGVALRARRTEINRRDLLDGLTVAIGASLVAWVGIANPLITQFDVNPGLAVTTAMYLPIAVLLTTFTTELFLTGLQRNRGMWFIMVAVASNLLGTLLIDFSLIDKATWGAGSISLGLFIAGFLFLCASVSHADLPATLLPIDESLGDDNKTPLRMILITISLISPAVLIAAVAPTSATDIAVRTTGTVALIVAAVTRLFMALQANARAQETLVRRLSRDEVTNLPTRGLFTEFVSDSLESTWRSEHQPTLIQLNLDRFKNLADSLGPSEANNVLNVIGERLTTAAATFDGFVARSTADEFVVIDATTTSTIDAMARAESIRASIAAPIPAGESSVFVTASFGVAVAPRNRTISAEEFMRRADIATHRAKSDGRNRVALFDESMQANLAHRMDVEHALHGAIGRQEMRLYHQPIVDIVSGQISGFEALIRWRRTDGTLVSPGDFIPIAEETGIICELGAWALREALTELRQWIDDGVIAATTTMSVNVSPRQIADPNFADVVRNALDLSGVPPHLLWLEMTETMMLEEPEIALGTLRHIRAMGVKLALDDFGTGYSSLSLLQQFPIQRIKIDRAFVQGVAERSTDRSLVRTMIAMAQSMGLDLVAEGVETVQQLQSLRELGCDKAQGYLISHPVPPDAMRTTMAALNEFASLSLFGPIESQTLVEDVPYCVPEPVESTRRLSQTLIKSTART